MHNPNKEKPMDTIIENALQRGKVFTRKLDLINDFPVNGPDAKTLGHVCKLNDTYYSTKKNYGKNILKFIDDCQTKESRQKKDICCFDSLHEAFMSLSPL